MVKLGALAITAATLIVWAGSYLLGIAEVIDLILLLGGVAALGLSVFEGAHEMLEFTTTATQARNDKDLDAARPISRAQLGMSGYARSALLRYLEEALAEGYAQLKVNGLVDILRAYRFPT